MESSPENVASVLRFELEAVMVLVVLHVRANPRGRPAELTFLCRSPGASFAPPGSALENPLVIGRFPRGTRVVFSSLARCSAQSQVPLCRSSHSFVFGEITILNKRNLCCRGYNLNVSSCVVSAERRPCCSDSAPDFRRFLLLKCYCPSEIRSLMRRRYFDLDTVDRFVFLLVRPSSTQHFLCFA